MHAEILSAILQYLDNLLTYKYIWIIKCFKTFIPLYVCMVYVNMFEFLLIQVLRVKGMQKHDKVERIVQGA